MTIEKSLQAQADDLRPWRYDHAGNGFDIKGHPEAAPIHGGLGRGKDTLTHILKSIKARQDFGALRALDLGCLEGHYSDLLCEHGFAEVVSVELSEQQASRAEFLLTTLRGHKNSRVVRGSVEDLSLLTSLGKFDLILFHGLLYHLVDPWNALKNIKAISQPDCTLLLSTQFKFPFAEIVTRSPVASFKVRSLSTNADGLTHDSETGAAYEQVAMRLNPESVRRALSRLNYEGLIAYDTPLGSTYGFQLHLIATRSKATPEFVSELNRGHNIPGLNFYVWSGNRLDGYDLDGTSAKLARLAVRSAYQISEYLGRSGRRQTSRRAIPSRVQED